MAAEETELTFVRCPNCRSLVPAVATRCRMCGQLIEKVSDSSQSADTRKVESSNQAAGGPLSNAPAGDEFVSVGRDSSGGMRKPRVRQRTMFASDSEFREIKDTHYSSADTSDNESERVDASAWQENNQPASEDDFSLERSKDLDDEDVFDTYDENLAEDVGDEELSTEGDITESGADVGTSNAVGGAAGPEHSRRRRRRRRRRRSKNIEAPSSAPLAGASLKPPVEEKVGGFGQGSDALVGERSPLGGLGWTQYKEHEEIEASETVFEEQVMSEAIHTPARGFQNDTGFRDNSVRPTPISVSPDQEGVLVGWIVDYSRDPKGSAREIRSGGFFIGTEQLRGNDLVLKHESISSPHCLVKVNADGVVMVQDLMSQRGTFLRRGGDGTYKQCNDPFTLENGDWLKIGNYEVLVCLIPSPKRRR